MNIRWAISGALIVMFVLIAIGNLSGAIYSRINRTGFSLVPFLCGLLGCLGFWFTRHPTLHRLWWLPFLLDCGSALLLVTTMGFLIRLRFGRKNVRGDS